jgi:glycerol kinase
MAMSGVLVVDVGTSSVRAAVFTPDGDTAHSEERELLPDSPADGLVEFDATLMAATSLELARAVIDAAGSVAGVAISNQRGSTIVWDRATGAPVGPGLGWQDLRTVGECLGLRGRGLRVAPNQSATKVAWLLDQLPGRGRNRDLCFGTVDTWIAWHLTGGAVHVTDATNSAVTGLQVTNLPTSWDPSTLNVLDIPEGMLPTIVDSAGVVGAATALPGAPPIAALVGDQQASLVGQGCVRPGLAKITFGTGGMLDVVTAEHTCTDLNRSPGGSFPIVAWSRDGQLTWGAEAIMLSAGTNVEWLVDDLGVLPDAAASHAVAAECADTDGVSYVPALLGLGSPKWDFGARGGLFGLTRGSGRPQVVRAVLEGVAQRGADLVEAAEADTDLTIGALRVDGGMSANPTFVQAVADATQRRVEVSPVVEATTLGAAYLAGLAVGTWSAIDDLAAMWRPATVVEPARVLDRERWRTTVERAAAWYPELTALEF